MQTHANQTNQPSGASAGSVTQRLTEADLDLSRLDRTVDRYQLLLLAKRVGKLGGFTPRMLQLLEYYMAYTTAKDWEEGSRPVVFQSLARTAMDLGVGERQIQKLEKRLFDIGAICWNDSGNHKRYGRRDPKTGRLVFAYGVDLTPLAYLQEELEAKLQEKQLYAEAWRAAKREICESRRRIREQLGQLRDEGAHATRLTEFEASYRKIAYELRSHIDLARLLELAKCHTRLLIKLEEHLQNPHDRSSASSPIAPATRKRSRSHAQKVHALRTDQSSQKKKAVLCELIAKHSQRGRGNRERSLGNVLVEQEPDKATTTLTPIPCPPELSVCSIADLPRSMRVSVHCPAMQQLRSQWIHSMSDRLVIQSKKPRIDCSWSDDL